MLFCGKGEERRYLILRWFRAGAGIAFLFVEQVGGFQQKGHPFFLTVGMGADPSVEKFLPGISEQSLAGVGNRDFIAFLVFLYPLHHHKMLLVPVDNTGQQSPPNRQDVYNN